MKTVAHRKRKPRDPQLSLKLEQYLYRHPVFRSKSACEEIATPSQQSAVYQRLRRQVQKKRLVSVVKGVYASVPPGVEPSTFSPDPYLVLHALRPGVVFCGHSALELHGVANSLWNTVTAYSSGPEAKFAHHDNQFKFFRAPKRLLGLDGCLTTVDRRGTLLQVTSPELTLVEGFRYTRRVGGIEELVKSAEDFRNLRHDVLLTLLDQFGQAKLYAAVGWFLTRYQAAPYVSDAWMQQLRAKRPRSAKYLEPQLAAGSLDKDWNLIIPRTLVHEELTGEF